MKESMHKHIAALVCFTILYAWAYFQKEKNSPHPIPSEEQVEAKPVVEKPQPVFSLSSQVKKSSDFEEYSEKLGLELTEPFHPPLLDMVSAWLDTPYASAESSQSGTDCSGFVQQVYRQVYDLPIARTAYDLYDACQPVARADLQEGDMVFFQIEQERISHVGVYLQKGYFVHATTSEGVKIDHLDQAYYEKYFVGGGRILVNSQELSMILR